MQILWKPNSVFLAITCSKCTSRLAAYPEDVDFGKLKNPIIFICPVCFNSIEVPISDIPQSWNVKVTKNNEEPCRLVIKAEEIVFKDTDLQSVRLSKR